MKLLELFEARRNPEINTDKTKGHAAALPLVKQLADQSPNVGVSMTELSKLGINPRSKYYTPIAICFYPANFYIEKKEKGSDLPFQEYANYIQILEATGNVLFIGDMDESQFSDMIKKIYAKLGEIASITGSVGDELQKTVNKAVIGMRSGANVDSYGGYFWYILYQIAKSFEDGEKTFTQNNVPISAIKWNKVIRILGIDAIIDNGSGILHPAEPYQGMIFNPRAVRLVKTIENQNAEEEYEFNYWLETYNKKLPPSEYIKYVCDGVMFNGSSVIDKDPGLARKTGLKVANLIKADPALITITNDSYITIIDKMIKSPSVAHFLYRLKAIDVWKSTFGDIAGVFSILDMGLSPTATPDVKSKILTLSKIYLKDADRVMNYISKAGSKSDPELETIEKTVDKLYAIHDQLQGLN